MLRPGGGPLQGPGLCRPSLRLGWGRGGRAVQLLELQGKGAQPQISDEETEAQTGPDLGRIAGAS